MNSDEQTAAACLRYVKDNYMFDEMHAAIVRALQAARTPPPGHIIDDAGVVRKLKGEFPITADGVMVQLGEDVWHPESGEALRVGEYEGEADHNKKPLADDCTFCAFFSYYETDTGYSEYEVYDVRQCYSTPEAAKEAK